MLYARRARAWWSGARTAFKFFATAAVLGLATTLVDAAGVRLRRRRRRLRGRPLAARLLAIATASSWPCELSILAAPRATSSSRRCKRTALLLRGELRRDAGARLALGVVGGVLAPLAVARSPARAPTSAALVVAALGCCALVAASCSSATLFFAAASPPRMPGGL